MLDKQKWQDLLKKAKAGNADAQTEVGLFYSDGYTNANQEVIVKKNSKLAYEWYEKAAQQGNVDAICSLAYHVDQGIGCETDKKRAVKLYEIAIDKGSGIAAFNLGTIYRDKGNYTKAFECYDLAMQMSRSDYSFTVGHCYYYGIGVQQDRSIAVRHFRKVSTDRLKLHYPYDRDLANYYLGLSYLTGDGLTRSLKSARKYLELANADNDNENARSLLHLIGRG